MADHLSMHVRPGECPAVRPERKAAKTKTSQSSEHVQQTSPSSHNPILMSMVIFLSLWSVTIFRPLTKPKVPLALIYSPPMTIEAEPVTASSLGQTCTKIFIDAGSNFDLNTRNSSSSMLLVNGSSFVFALTGGQGVGVKGQNLTVQLPVQLPIADGKEGLSIYLHTEYERGPRVDIPPSLFLSSPVKNHGLDAYRYCVHDDDEYLHGNQVEYRRVILLDKTARRVFLRDIDRDCTTRRKDAESTSIWLMRSFPEYLGNCWSPKCTTLVNCLQAPSGNVTNSAVLSSLRHIPARIGESIDHFKPIFGALGRNGKKRIHIVGDSVASSIYSAMAILLGENWCTAVYRGLVKTAYTNRGKDNTTSPITANNENIQLSYRFQVNFCVEEKVKKWSQERLLRSMDITTPIDFLLLQGGLWDLQDRNIAECLTVFPQIVNAVLNFQPSIEILLVSPGPLRYPTTPSKGYRTNRRLLQFRNMMQELSAQHANVHFYDTYMTLLPVSYFASDRRHYPQHIMINVAAELYETISHISNPFKG